MNCKTALTIVTLTAALSISAAAPAKAELQLPKPSPQSTVSQRIGLTDISIEYSSPGVKGRSIWGDLVPYDKIWRTGANACTKISFSEDVVFSGANVKKGSYCLFTVPGKKAWSVILNKDTSLWGAGGYDEAKNAAEVSISPLAAPFRERMTFLVEDFDSDSGQLTLSWEKLAVSIPIEVDTPKHAKRNINTLGSDASPADLSSAAQYLLENTEEIDKAMELAVKSAEKEKNWRNQWVKAKILKKQGKTEEAAASAKDALTLGDDSGAFNFYKSQIEKAVSDWS